MIVLDEQLQGRQLEIEIAKWYQGTVCIINELRPHSVIKDDAIPELLRLKKSPTFITINEKDFWQKIAITPYFCIVCFILRDTRVREISPLLRSLFQLEEFKTKAQRMGKVIRVSDKELKYYTFNENEVKSFPFLFET